MTSKPMVGNEMVQCYLEKFYSVHRRVEIQAALCRSIDER